MLVIDSDINSIDCFYWQDVYFAIKSAKLVRDKNKVPVQTFEGKSGLLITIRFTQCNVMHVSWESKNG